MQSKGNTICSAISIPVSALNLLVQVVYRRAEEGYGIIIPKKRD